MAGGKTVCFIFCCYIVDYCGLCFHGVLRAKDMGMSEAQRGDKRMNQHPTQPPTTTPCTSTQKFSSSARQSPVAAASFLAIKNPLAEGSPYQLYS